jgi:hypothetical protein
VRQAVSATSVGEVVRRGPPSDSATHRGRDAPWEGFVFENHHAADFRMAVTRHADLEVF